MGHFAKVLNGVVQQVIVAEPEFFDILQDTSPGRWVQTSYNTRGNVHYGPDGLPSGKEPVRGNYAGIGYIYDSGADVFYSPCPHDTWILNPNTWTWEPPRPMPTDAPEGTAYYWSDETKDWATVSITLPPTE
jgi:hypothetical protein